MSVQDFLRIVSRRWQLIVLLTLLTVGGTLLYARLQPRIYQASATIFAHPSGVTSPSDYSSDVGLLTYGTLADTFAALAQSQRLLTEAAGSLGLSAQVTRHYSVTATTIAQTTVLQISVDGPDPALAMHLANGLAVRAAVATAAYYHIFALSPLDKATLPTHPISPQTTHDLLYGSLAGVIFGFVVAALSLYLPQVLDPARAGASRAGGYSSGWTQPPVPRMESVPRQFSVLPDAYTARALATSADPPRPADGSAGELATQLPLLRRPQLPGQNGGNGRPATGRQGPDAHR